MLRLVIIDDEQEQVQGIRNSISWEKYDIEVCDVAYNGIDGLTLFEKHTPHIAIIDIQMPYMNGLTLIEDIRKLYYNTQIIILSGHDKFEYAKKAINLEVNNYLLKPCSIEEILQATLRAKNIVLEEQNRKKIFDQYNAFFNQYICMFRDKLLNDLLDNKLRNQSTFFEDTKKYHIKLKDAMSCVAVFKFENIDSIYNQNTNEDFDFLIIRITEFFKKKQSERYHFEIVIKRDDIVLILSHDYFNFNNFVAFIKQAQIDIEEQFEYPFIVGIGNLVSSPLNVSKSYNQAMIAIENTQFLGEERFMVYNNYMSEVTTRFTYPFEEEKAIFSCIELCENTKLNIALDNFFDKFDQSLEVNINYIRKIGFTLLTNIFTFCNDKNIDILEINQLLFTNMDKIINTQTFENLKKIIKDVLRYIVNSLEKQVNNRLVQHAIDYIHMHACENINLTSIATKLGITPAYFSFLFKQNMKINFVDYLNQHRIELAKKLLIDVQLKNYEVAYQVGYQDEKYFYKLFKRITGLTPSQYRDTQHILD